MLLQLVKNVQKIHKKWLWSEVVVPKNIFTLYVTVFNSRESFFQSTVFLHLTKVFHEIINHFATGIALADMLCVHNVRFTGISIWGLLLFQRSTCSHTFQWYLHYPLSYSDLVLSMVFLLCFLETSTCIHPVFRRYWVNSSFQLQPSIWWMARFIIKEQLQPRILSNLLYILEQELYIYYIYIHIYIYIDR